MSGSEPDTYDQEYKPYNKLITTPMGLQLTSKDQPLHITSSNQHSSTGSGRSFHQSETWQGSRKQRFEDNHEWKNKDSSKGNQVKKVYRKCQNRHQKQEKPPNQNSNLYKKEQTTKVQAAVYQKKGGFNQKKQTKGPVLYPCSFCNKDMTLEQMDKHHKQCQMAFQCDLCADFFPLALIEDHAKCCRMRKSKNYKNINDRQKVPERRQPQWRRPIMQAFKVKNEEKKLTNMGYDRRSWENTEEQNKIYEQMQLQQFGIKLDEDHYSPSKKPHINMHYRNYNNPFRNYRQPSYDDSSEQEHDDLYFPQKEKPSVQGLTEKEINRLATDTFKKSSANESECGICTNEQEEGDLVIRLPCFHTFHSECLVPWLKMKSVCPKCKHCLKSK